MQAEPVRDSRPASSGQRLFEVEQAGRRIRCQLSVTGVHACEVQFLIDGVVLCSRLFPDRGTAERWARERCVGLLLEA